jgi:hypothetical protein
VEDRVGLARAIERDGGKGFQPMIDQLKSGMLAGNQQPNRLAKRGEGMGNRAELDGFGPCSGNERDTILAQLPP